MPRPALRPSMLLATGFGAGYVPIAPGTAGSAVGVLLFYFLCYLIEECVKFNPSHHSNLAQGRNFSEGFSQQRIVERLKVRVQLYQEVFEERIPCEKLIHLCLRAKTHIVSPFGQ